MNTRYIAMFFGMLQAISMIQTLRASEGPTIVLQIPIPNGQSIPDTLLAVIKKHDPEHKKKDAEEKAQEAQIKRRFFINKKMLEKHYHLLGASAPGKVGWENVSYFATGEMDGDKDFELKLMADPSYAKEFRKRKYLQSFGFYSFLLGACSFIAGAFGPGKNYYGNWNSINKPNLALTLSALTSSAISYLTAYRYSSQKSHHWEYYHGRMYTKNGAKTKAKDGFVQRISTQGISPDIFKQLIYVAEGDEEINHAHKQCDDLILLRYDKPNRLHEYFKSTGCAIGSIKLG